MELPLKYVSRPSSLKENAPLLLMLHGYGSDQKDLFSFASELPKEFFIISVQAPYPLAPYGYAWYAINFDAEQNKWSDNEQAVQSRDIIADFIDKACEKYSLDSSKVNLLGFSQGTILSYAVALTYPEKVKNIVALSGYINEDILPKDLKHENYSHLDFYISHGSLDQVIPAEWARKAPVLLDRLHINNSYSEFPVGHGVSPQNFYDLRKWLDKKI